MKKRRFKPNREFTYKSFRERYGVLTFKQRRYLVKFGIIMIFQGGFRGHSACHAKKIRVLNFVKLKAYIKSLNPIEPEKPELTLDPPSYSLKTKIVSPKPKTVGISRRDFKAVAVSIRGDYDYPTII